jgi:hypothetical protein
MIHEAFSNGGQKAFHLWQMLFAAILNCSRQNAEPTAVPGVTIQNAWPMKCNK